MKNIITIIFCMMIINLSGQQWIDDSCNKKASKIANKAIDHLANLEYMMAYAMANAALIVDEDCQCAKLVKAGATSAAANWGSRKQKLDDVDVSKLGGEEKVWYSTLTATLTGDSDKYQKSLKDGLADYPDSPILNWLSTGTDFDANKKFAKKFPTIASGSYNFMAYQYARGNYDGEPDLDMAYEMIDKSMALHDGPNILDSKAEIAAENGDYETALSSQLKAHDYSSIGSQYWQNAVMYWHKLNKETVADNLKKAQVNMQNAILEKNEEEFKKYVSDDESLVVGDSNLGEFYNYTLENLNQEALIDWDSFDIRDIDVHFSSDMTMAYLTFYADGAYTFKESGESVDYNTRASAVWIRTGNGWKSIHANWAPTADGTGIPQQ
ncbi:MAG: hypothetical protein CM15mP101_02790 [Flavobacteriaceae bacterium]|nr:MAG: hypothetical protein CM15mP101_02790 [Flavobacteriaceae bacterium]